VKDEVGQASTSRNEVLEGKPPEIVENVVWLWRRGWRHKWPVAVAALVLVGMWLLADPRVGQLLNHGASESPSVSGTVATDGVVIKDVSLVRAEQGVYPYENERLYTLAIHGSYAQKLERKRYAMIFFYRSLAEEDQRLGWFVIKKLDQDGFGHANSVSLDEVAPDSWTFHTTGLYLSSAHDVVLALRAILLPRDVLEKLDDKISNDENGWGKQSLSFLTDLPEVIATDTAEFRYAQSN